MSLDSDPISRDGWAIRRPERCYGFEKGHHTWGRYWSCCPPNTREFIDKDFETRCYLDDERTDSDFDSPASEAKFPTQCANSSSVLWAYQDNYFCCEDSMTGFVNEETALGCATEQDVREGENNQTMWGADQKGQPNVPTTTSPVSASTVSLSPKTSAPTTSTYSSSASEPSASTFTISSSSSSTNKGAIAGGVVGGVGGALVIAEIIWFLMRRKRRVAGASEATPPGVHFDAGNVSKQGGGSPSAEPVDAGRPRYELPTAVAPE